MPSICAKTGRLHCVEAGFDPQQPTAWSAEGLLVYLPPEAQDRLFDNITALSAPGSRIATEHMDMRDVPADWAERLTERSQRIGSNINLAELFYTGDRNPAADYLGAHGWRTDIKTTEQAYRRQRFRGTRRRVGVVRSWIWLPDSRFGVGVATDTVQGSSGAPRESTLAAEMRQYSMFR